MADDCAGLLSYQRKHQSSCRTQSLNYFRLGAAGNGGSLESGIDYRADEVDIFRDSFSDKHIGFLKCQRRVDVIGIDNDSETSAAIEMHFGRGVSTQYSDCNISMTVRG